jgi:hypothetical protein
MRVYRFAAIAFLLCLLLGDAGVHAPAVRAVGAWTPAAPLKDVGYFFTATTLPDGQVLAVGGEAFRPDGTFAAVNAAHRYDPLADRWLPAAPMSISREFHTPHFCLMARY